MNGKFFDLTKSRVIAAAERAIELANQHESKAEFSPWDGVMVHRVHPTVFAKMHTAKDWTETEAAYQNGNAPLLCEINPYISYQGESEIVMVCEYQGKAHQGILVVIPKN